MVDSSKASRADSIGINDVESDNSNVHDHGNYDVAIPLVAIKEVSNRFDNTLYGYFIGKRLAFPIVENYVKTLGQSMELNVLCYIMDFSSSNYQQSKLHNVPIVAYSEIGLSLITTKLGRPIMLDAYTCNMCLKSWGRNNYARALIEVSSENVLVDSLVVAILFQNESRHTMEMQSQQRLFGKLTNVNGEASTSQPNEKKEPSAPHPNNKGKDMSDLQEINIFSLRNSFDALMEKDKFFEVNNETWKASNDVGSILDDSEEVKNVFVEDNRKPMDCLVDDARKKVEAPPKKNPMNCTNGAFLFCLVNIMAWRVWLDNLPTRFNLSSRGLEIPSLTCPLCNVSVESTSHLLFSCSLVRQLWIKVFCWWDIDAADFLSYDEWLTWLKNIRMPKGLKDIFEGVYYVMWRVLWRFRNQTLFGNALPR
ncbi:RNA-directed DNA polymerase, eukaryota, reverse transcriptase zinc-binding domain protein [Tanacetum coccineum]